MQVSAICYPSISAKLKGMYFEKLKQTDIEELIKQNTIEQAIALLKSLNKEFKNLEENAKRINLKMQLDDILIKDIKKIDRLLGKADKKLFSEFISIYEIKCIKSVFRRLSSGSIINEQTNEVENWTQKLLQNLKQIEEVKNDEEFANFLKKTPYYLIFKQYNTPIKDINIFEVENKLDKFYFERLMKIAKKYNHHLEDMIGKQIDLNNIVWIYRVKNYYHFSIEQTKDILFNLHYKLKKIEIEKMIEANSLKEMIEILKTTYYAKYLDFNDMKDLEQNIDRYLYKIYQKYFRGSIFDITMIYAYINIVEKENNDILNVIEGIRYHLSNEEIRKKLVR